MTQPTGGGLLVIERLLRDRDSIWQQIIEERDLKPLTLQMLASSALSLALYGAVLGASNGALMALSSFVKLPLLFLATLAICLPTLYLFNLVFGARLQVRQALALVLVAITVIAMLALAFAPISLFFLITANQYSFYKLLNVAILTLAALVGLRFLTGGMAALNKHNSVRDAFARAAAEAEATAQVRAVGGGAGAATGKAASGAETSSDGAGGAIPVSAAPAGAAEAAPVSPAPAAPVPGSPAVPVSPAPAGVPVVPHPHLPVPVGNGAGVLVAAPPRFVAPGVPAQPVPWAARQAALPAEKQASMTLLYVWILLFGFVGTQLAWTLRPFFGSPGQDFELFRSIDGNFYVDIVRTIGGLF